MASIKGHCLCKSIQFKINSECRKSVFCHCKMCQRSNSEFSLYTKVNLKNFIITDSIKLVPKDSIIRVNLIVSS